MKRRAKQVRLPSDRLLGPMCTRVPKESGFTHRRHGNGLTRGKHKYTLSALRRRSTLSGSGAR